MSLAPAEEAFQFPTGIWDPSDWILREADSYSGISFQFPTGIWDPSDFQQAKTMIRVIWNVFQFPTGIWDPSDRALLIRLERDVHLFQFPTGIWDPSDSDSLRSCSTSWAMFQFPTGIWDPSDNRRWPWKALQNPRCFNSLREFGILLTQTTSASTTSAFWFQFPTGIWDPSDSPIRNWPCHGEW